MQTYSYIEDKNIEVEKGGVGEVSGLPSLSQTRRRDAIINTLDEKGTN